MCSCVCVSLGAKYHDRPRPGRTQIRITQFSLYQQIHIRYDFYSGSAFLFKKKIKINFRLSDAIIHSNGNYSMRCE